MLLAAQVQHRCRGMLGMCRVILAGGACFGAPVHMPCEQNPAALHPLSFFLFALFAGGAV